MTLLNTKQTVCQTASPENRKWPSKSVIAAVTIALFGMSACASSHSGLQKSEAPNIVQIDHEGATPLAKADYAEITRVDLPSYESIPPHQGGNRIILSLNSYTLSFDGQGQSDLSQFQAGDIHFRPAGLHQVENIGPSPAEFVIFERLSSKPLPQGEPSKMSDVTPIPEKNASELLLFSNERFDVYKVSIAPGGRLAPHMGYARAVYSLDDYEIDFHENGETMRRTFYSGQAHFHNPGTHWLKNAGVTQANFIVVDYKR